MKDSENNTYANISDTVIVLVYLFLELLGLSHQWMLSFVQRRYFHLNISKLADGGISVVLQRLYNDSVPLISRKYEPHVQ